MSILRFSRCRIVKSPSRGTKNSSGIDFFIPTDLKTVAITPFDAGHENFEVAEGFIDIEPGTGILIPTGIKTIIEPGYDLVFDNKSGIATKKGLVIGAKVIDADYRGEIHVHLINTSRTARTVFLGDKIAQAILRKVELEDPEEISEEEFQEEANTERGTGGFGSTGNN